MGVLTKGVRTRSIESDSVIGWFISPHGFGHAARGSAIMNACSARQRGLHHHVFTSVPHEFFRSSLPGVSFDYHRLECDVGMVQKNPFEEDIGETIRALGRLTLEGGPELDAVVTKAAATGCRLIVCDIAPLGLVVADRLAVPGVLVENFTWDWIYRAYGDPGLDEFGEFLREIFSTATLRIQTQPACRSVADSHGVAPVSRALRKSRMEIRRSLGIAAHRRMVLVSVSGLHEADVNRRGLRPPPATTLVIPGAVDRVSATGEVIWIPVMGGPYHPDLVAASDLVIAKLGYSTVAEVHHAGTAFAYLRRPRFPESPILEAFVREHIPSVALTDDWLEDPSTPKILEDLLANLRPTVARPNGADEAARLILNALQGQF